MATMDGWMMGDHMVWAFSIALALVIAVTVALIVFLRPPNPVAVSNFEQRFGGPRLDSRRPASEAPRAAHDAVSEKIVIVIPDISGYTRFITKSRFALAHAHFVIEELLDSILEAGSTCFVPMRIEGDAIVFRASFEKLDADAVGTALVSILEAFYRKRANLQHDSICGCSICRNIAELDLKIIVHAGEVLRFHMGEFEDATGEAMIDAHRLLKGVTHTHRYILATEACFDAIRIPTQWKWDDHPMPRHDKDAMACFLAIVPDDDVAQWTQPSRSRRVFSDVVKKTVFLAKSGRLGSPRRSGQSASPS